MPDRRRDIYVDWQGLIQVNEAWSEQVLVRVQAIIATATLQLQQPGARHTEASSSHLKRPDPVPWLSMFLEVTMLAMADAGKTTLQETARKRSRRQLDRTDRR